MSAAAPILFYAPTASGKSAIALDWAARTSGAIVNADALQVYDALPILNATPDAQDRSKAVHKLYAFADPASPMTAPLWAQHAATVLQETPDALVVGGTGMYLKTLIDGIAPIPDVPPGIREEVEAMRAEMGAQEFHDELARVDPAIAATIHPHHRQRAIRAYEVWKATGKPLSHFHAQPHTQFVRDHFLVVYLPDKAWILERAAKRFDVMLRQGVLDEVREFASKGGADMPASQALGFHALHAHVKGEMSLQDAKESVLRDTAAFIKRQLTWGRQQFAKRESAAVVTTSEEASQALA